MPMNRSNYPPNWLAISYAIRKRDGHHCLSCNTADLTPHPSGKHATVILTVAHLDHDTTNNDPDNLVTLCQRCHLAYDQSIHIQHAAQTRDRKRNDALRDHGQLTLPLGATP